MFSFPPPYMSSTVGPSIHPSRAHQFYGGLTFASGSSSASLPSLHSGAGDRRNAAGGARRESKFLQEKRRTKPCFESVVDSLESVKGEWRCVYCSLAVEIDNKTNQVRCPQCQAKHLEAPRRPTRGLLPAR